VTRSVSSKLGAYVGLAGLGLLAALATGRPELAAVAAPFALVAAAGLLLSGDPRVEVAAAALERDRALEGDELSLRLVLTAERTVPRLELLLRLPPGLALAEGRNPVAIRLAADDPRTLDLRLRCERWGGYLVGETLVRAHAAFGLFAHDRRFPAGSELKVYPRQEALRHLVPPLETQPYSGDEVSRRRGEGIEFADLRPFAYGDPVRHINWRASARRGQLWVNQRHPERNTDVVIFLDTFTEARRGSAGTLDLALRAAATLTAHYVKRRDRVGFVSFGGVLRWLKPGTGLTQLYRMVDALLDTEIWLNYAWKNIDIVPARTLPPQALVIALTPLLDERSVRALLDLRARGFDLAVVETSPIPFVDPGPSEEDRLAFRLWSLRRDALRSRYHAAGVAVVEWRDGVPLEQPIEEVSAFRRNARLVRV
jgi:uncharacterized protein (DUF58 family)